MNVSGQWFGQTGVYLGSKQKQCGPLQGADRTQLRGGASTFRIQFGALPHCEAIQLS